jgi:hypothetical protein
VWGFGATVVRFFFQRETYRSQNQFSASFLLLMHEIYLKTDAFTPVRIRDELFFPSEKNLDSMKTFFCS